jgi:uncharacterized protein (TIGR00304 family)
MPSFEPLHLIAAGIGFILLGFVLLLAGAVLSGDSSIEGGGVIFIGPIPIIFGSSKKNALLALGIGLLALIFLYIFRDRAGL